jgi:cytochrome P450 / NADPH-cytochrome P450 reductase
MTTTGTMIDVEDFPGPRGVPVLGNLFDLDQHNPIPSVIKLAQEYGPIFKLSTPNATRVIVSGHELVNEVCDDARFDKFIAGGLIEMSKGVAGHGLFTTKTEDPRWQRAHAILMAPFSMQAMEQYVPKMQDIADQLLGKWDRLNSDDIVDVPADMTNLTLDTIALCGFGYRFNSFYRETPHPFVAAMIRSLLEAQTRARQMPIRTRLQVRAKRQFDDDQAYMQGLVDSLINERRQQGDAADNTDLLGRMLEGRDPRTGEGLDDENIRNQCVTFLTAGHETTSGLLSFAIYFLMKNPDVARRARAEVDEMLGGTLAPTFEQIHRLTYVTQVLNETLRLWPTAPGFNRYAREDTVIGGRYRLPAGTSVMVMSAALHRDKSVWGPDAEEYNPDHVAPDKLGALPPDAFKPFGTGQRACIGRQFAMQEAILVLALLLQRFDFVDAFDYELKIKTTLTIKPDEMRIQVVPRPDRLLDAPVTRLAAAPTVAEELAPTLPAAARHNTPLRVLFGSDLGTAEGIATRLAQEGTERGYSVVLGALDDHVGDLPSDGASILVSSSYNGLPPANAKEFCKWLNDPPADQRPTGAPYAVFGCGNTEWAATYQAVPILLDTKLSELGGRRIHPRGEGDVRSDFDAQYRAWHDSLWSDLASTLDLPASAADPAAVGPRLSISLVNRQKTNPVIISYEAAPARVAVNRELATALDGHPAERSTRHVEIALPEGTTYQTGDHLGVLPRNHPELIRRTMFRFGLDAGQYLTIVARSGSHTHLPIDEPTPLLGVLGTCVELQDVAKRSDIEMMVSYTDDPEQRAALKELIGDDPEAQSRYRERVFLPNRSLLDLLEEFPGCALPFEVYLDLLPPLRPRYYSISSSPLVDQKLCSITTGVLRAPARSGHGEYAGICSNHLATSPDNSTVFVFVRDPGIGFRPPENAQVPMIMVGAGTGLAPYRGFLQERATLKHQGSSVAESLLFFGCRNPNADYLYADELREFESLGVARVVTAFSRVPGQPRQYVQDAIQEHGEEVWSLLRQGAYVFVCGNARTIAPAVRAALTAIHHQQAGGPMGDSEAWLANLRAENRYVEDIWGG